MKITPQRARKAFYQAAANIEAKPELYVFGRLTVGNGNYPACMWGHVGRVLGISAGAMNGDVAKSIGFSDTGVIYNYSEDSNPSGFFHPESKYFTFQTNRAADRLRAFADHHWPANSADPAHPDLIECGQSFRELMASFGSEVA